MDRATSGQVSSAAAELYERFYVPALFGQWPPRLLRAAGVAPGARVLDVACGTGVLARAAKRQVGPSGTVVGVDVNPGMLAVAARTEPDVTWTPGEAESLPLPDRSVDHAFCQFGLMFFRDRRAAVGEMARVVRRGGTVCVATWADLSETPGYAAMVGLLRELFGPVPADALAAPFTLGTPAELEAVLTPVLGRVTAAPLDGVASFPSVDDWVTTDVLAWTLDDLLDAGQIDALRTHARDRLRRFCDPSGAVRFAAPALVALVRT